MGFKKKGFGSGHRFKTNGQIIINTLYVNAIHQLLKKNGTFNFVQDFVLSVCVVQCVLSQLGRRYETFLALLTL
jgi:hypothetical protein